MPSDVERWLEALPEKAIEEELDELRLEVKELQRKIEAREQALAVKQAFSGDDLQRLLEGALPAPAPRGGERLRGRRAVRAVIEQTPHRKTWTIPDMLAAIRERGWIANSHAVQVNLSRMYRDGELGKAGTGVYVPIKEKEVPTEADTS